MSAPHAAVTLGVRSVGHYRERPGEIDLKIIKHFIQLFWSVKGTGVINLKGRPRQLKPGMIAFYFPGDIHDLEFPGPGRAWEFRWVTLDGELALPIVEGFKFTNSETYHAGPAPIALFEKLTARLRDVTLTGELEAGALAFELLSKAAERARPWTQPSERKRRPAPSRHRDALQAFKVRTTEVIRQHWDDPTYGIEQIAAELGFHRSVFSRKFHTAFGLSPSHYLLRWRVQNALNQLRNSSLPIAEVARSCGWEDSNYFARCIGKVTGMSPSEFRNSGAITPAAGKRKRQPFQGG